MKSLYLICRLFGHKFVPIEENARKAVSKHFCMRCGETRKT